MKSEHYLIKKRSQLNDILQQNKDSFTQSEYSKIDAIHSTDIIKTHLESLKTAERLLKIGIIGRVKAGKSSLINSLFFEGQNVLPKAATPMTAALTTINYSDHFSAKVEFLSKEDLKNLELKSQQYENRLKAAIHNEIEQRKEKLKSKGSNDDLDIDKIEQRVTRRFKNENSSLESAADLYNRIKKSSIQFSDLNKEQILNANSEIELAKMLTDYVGSEGKYMPFTRSLHVSFPNEQLLNVEIVDTPGLNDVVVSRSERTYEMLKECNVVFIVSPAGQFLNADDIDLANRLSEREGIQEIYIVASQVDTQLFGSEKDRFNGELFKVIDGIKSILEESAQDVLSSQENPVLNKIANQQKERLFVTSGICQTFLLQNKEQWDENAKHVFEHLKHNYPDFFTDTKKEESLNKLIGLAPLQQVISNVHHRKEEILKEQVKNYINNQTNFLSECIKELITGIKARINDIESTDLSKLQNEIDKLQHISKQGSAITQRFFIDQVDKLGSSIKDRLNTIITKKERELNQELKDSEGVATITGQREKSGLLSWVARKCNFGGYEDYNYTVKTFNSSVIRDALEHFRSTIIDSLDSEVRETSSAWQKKLAEKLASELRSVIKEDHIINTDKINQAVRLSLDKLHNLNSVDLSKLPGYLLQGNFIKGSEVDEYAEKASNYINNLMSEVKNYRVAILSEVDDLTQIKLGDDLFSHLQNNLMQLNKNINDKEVVIQQLNNIINQLGAI
ncbi:dynamin family protein [Providencia stuartii]|uniref:dynamin family protein n=1 Tax=Providencia stuartii TaxID=588 RepID=UPI0037F62C24